MVPRIARGHVRHDDVLRRIIMYRVGDLLIGPDPPPLVFDETPDGLRVEIIRIIWVRSYPGRKHQLRAGGRLAISASSACPPKPTLSVFRKTTPCKVSRLSGFCRLPV